VRYFFHILADRDRIEDPDGSLCADLSAARIEALESGRHLIADWVRRGRPISPRCLVEIADEHGRALDVISVDTILFGQSLGCDHHGRVDGHVYKEGPHSNPEPKLSAEFHHSVMQEGADLQSVLERTLAESLKVCGTELGNVQLMNWRAGCLEIKTQRGFNDEFLSFFKRVHFGDGSACARALKSRKPVIIEDITLDPEFRFCSAIMHRAGVRAVQSTPLVSRYGAFVGVLSTHFLRSHRPTDLQMRAVADAAHCAAEVIIRFRAEATARACATIQKSLKSIDESQAALARAEEVLRRLSA
jgi:GAF domain-containing protein